MERKAGASSKNNLFELTNPLVFLKSREMEKVTAKSLVNDENYHKKRLTRFGHNQSIYQEIRSQPHEKQSLAWMSDIHKHQTAKNPPV